MEIIQQGPTAGAIGGLAELIVKQIAEMRGHDAVLTRSAEVRQLETMAIKARDLDARAGQILSSLFRGPPEPSADALEIPDFLRRY